MKAIPLTHGQVALIDDEDYEAISLSSWRAYRCKTTYYAHRHETINGKRFLISMHRQIACPYGLLEVDHKDGNGLNNSRQNLRLATHAQNVRNARKRKDGASSYKGVGQHNGRWRARIRFENKPLYLGAFHAEEDAARAYDAKAKELFGEFAKLNFP